ncbi:MAG: hypothetical protein WBF90_21960 [Rivularia sp. (in: cyanobacteria)]
MHYQTKLFNVESYQKVEIDYSPIYDPAWDNTDTAPEPPKLVLEQVNKDTVNSAPEQYNHWIEEYSPSNRKHLKYFRYCYMVGRKICHVHIPGGNINTPLVLYRKLDIEDLIVIGKSPDEIVKVVKSSFGSSS